MSLSPPGFVVHFFFVCFSVSYSMWEGSVITLQLGDEGDMSMETITENGLSVEDRFQVQTKQGNLLLEV